MAARVVCVVNAVLALRGVVDNAGERIVGVARLKDAVSRVICWYRHAVKLRAWRRRRWALGVLGRFFRATRARRERRKRVACGRVLAAFLASASAVTPAARLLLTWGRFASAQRVVRGQLIANSRIGEARRVATLIAWKDVEAELRVEWASRLAEGLLHCEASFVGGKAEGGGALVTAPTFLPYKTQQICCAILGEGRFREKLGARALRFAAAALSASLKRREVFDPKQLPKDAAAQEVQFRANTRAIGKKWEAVVGVAAEDDALSANKYVLDGAARAVEAGERELEKALTRIHGMEGLGEGSLGKNPSPKAAEREKRLWAEDCPALLRHSLHKPTTSREIVACLSPTDFHSPLALAPYLARYLLPPLPPALRIELVSSLLCSRKKERVVLERAWRERVVLLAPLVRKQEARARQVAVLGTRGASGDDHTEVEDVRHSVPWQPAMPNLLRLFTRPELRPTIEGALLQYWRVS